VIPEPRAGVLSAGRLVNQAFQATLRLTTAALWIHSRVNRQRVHDGRRCRGTARDGRRVAALNVLRESCAAPAVRKTSVGGCRHLCRVIVQCETGAGTHTRRRWQGRLLKLGQKPSEQDFVLFDTALTVSAMRYIRAIHCGRVNPKEFKFQLDMGGEPLALADFIQTQVVNAGDRVAEIQKMEPPFLGYRKLLAL
jgi:hypothetical protein